MRAEHIIIGKLRYELHRDWRLVEIGPERCLAGHPLKAGNVTIGWDGEHATYTCWQCRADGDPRAKMCCETVPFGGFGHLFGK